MRAPQRIVGRAGVIGLCAGAGFAWSSAQAAQVTANWLAPVSGSWVDATKWSTPQFPNNGNPAGTTYHAVIDAVGGPYTVTLGQNVAIDALTLDSSDATLRLSQAGTSVQGDSIVQAGTLWIEAGSWGGAGDLRVHGTLRLGMSDMTGFGHTTIEADGALLMDGSASRALSRRLNIYGEALWTSGDLIVQGGGSIRNVGTLTLDASAGGFSASRSSGSSGTLWNEGTVRKRGSDAVLFLGGGTTGLALVNSGEVIVEDGRLALLASASHTGVFEVASGATIEFGGAQTFSETASWSGNGRVRMRDAGSENVPVTHAGNVDVRQLDFIDSNTVFNGHVFTRSIEISGGMTRFNAGLTVEPSGRIQLFQGRLELGGAPHHLGDVQVHSGVLSAISGLTLAGEESWWRGGYLLGPGGVLVSETASFEIDGDVQLSTTLTNRGSLVWAGGSIEIDSAGLIQNEAQFTIDVSGSVADTAAGRARNTGLLVKAGTGHAAIGLENHGQVRVDEGALRLLGSESHQGSFEVAKGAMIEFWGDSFGLVEIAGVTGLGGVSVLNYWKSSGDVRAGSFRSSGSRVKIIDGVLDVGTLTVGSLNQSELRLNGGGVAQTFAWSGGTIRGTGLIVEGDADFDNQLVWSGGDLILNGSTNVSVGSLTIGGPSRLVNDGTLTIDITSNFVWRGGGGHEPGGMTNNGVWILTGGGSAEIDSPSPNPFVNHGSLQIQQGSMRLFDGLQNSGSIEISSGATLRVDGPSEFAGGSSASGAGLLELRGGPHTFLGGGTSLGRVLLAATLETSGEVQAQELQWLGGAISGEGLVRVASGGVLTISGGGSKQIRGTLAQDGHGVQSSPVAFDGGVLLNSGEFELSGGASIVATANGGAIENTGLLRVTGAGIVIDLPSLRNDGALGIDAGATLTLNKPLTHNGTAHIEEGGTLRLTGPLFLGADAEFHGAGQFDLVSGSFAFQDELLGFDGSLSLLAGTANFAGDLHIEEQLVISNGVATLGGNLSTSSTGTVRLNGIGSLDHGGGIVEAASMVQLLGTLTGSGDVVVDQSLTWSGGSHAGAGRTIVDSGATLIILGPNTSKTLSREFINNGSGEWRFGQMRFEGGTFVNNGALTIRTLEGLPIEAQGRGGENRFINNGLLIKEGPALVEFETIDSAVRFENYGEVEVREGRLSIQDAEANQGAFEVQHHGELEIRGDFTNGSAAMLSFQVGGMKERGLSGLMTITDEASLAGTLSVETPEAFSATWGDRWVVMSYGAVDGDFDVFDLPTSGFASRSDEFGASDLRWYAERGETEYAVGVSHVADIDHDGLIGFADLNVIASNFNAIGSWAEGDVDGDGFVGFTDLNAVLSLFNVAAPRSVPGPGGVVVLVLAAGSGPRRRRESSGSFRKG